MLLVCFHCAGCDSSMFTSKMVDGAKAENALVDYCVSNNITLVCLNLRGRGMRSRERLGDLNEEVQLILRTEFNKPDRDLSRCSWALVGHSMGGVCCYAFYYYACVIGKARNPEFVILSASWDDSIGPRPWPATSTLSDEQFRRELLDKWKLNPKVGENADLWSMLKGRLRDDFCALENYQAPPEAAAPFPVTHLIGDQDYYIKPDMIQRHARWLSDFKKCEIIEDADHALFHNREIRNQIFSRIVTSLRQCSAKLSEEASAGSVSEDDDFVECF